jgi:hypothetical protein
LSIQTGTRKGLRAGTVAASALALLAWGARDAYAQYFLYKELNFSAAFSGRQERLDLSGHPPQTSAGLDYYHSFEGIEGRFFRLAFANVHFNVAYDPVADRFQIVFGDAYMRWKAHEGDSFLLAGQFNMPFGINPIQQPRGIFLGPLEALDLGFKKDWGLAYSSPFGDYWYKVALTTGTGTGVHTPEGSYLVSGRIGSPTFVDFEHGFSLLYGQVPTIRGIDIVDPEPVERWRMGLDFIYRYRSRVTFMGETAFGRDGDRQVWGLLARATVFPKEFDKWQLAGVFQSWSRDATAPRAHDTQFITEAAVSATEKVILRLDWVHDFNRAEGPEDDQVFAQVFYYAF